MPENRGYKLHISDSRFILREVLLIIQRRLKILKTVSPRNQFHIESLSPNLIRSVVRRNMYEHDRWHRILRLSQTKILIYGIQFHQCRFLRFGIKYGSLCKRRTKINAQILHSASNINFYLLFHDTFFPQSESFP